MSCFGKLRWDGASTGACKGHCRLYCRETRKLCNSLILTHSCVVLLCAQMKLNRMRQPIAFSKSCEPLIGSESIIGFVESGFAGMGS